MMNSLLNSIQKFHREAKSGEGTYTMDARFHNVDRELKPMSQAGFVEDPDEISPVMFDILENINRGVSGCRHMEQVVYSDIVGILRGDSGAYLRSGTIVTRKRIQSTEKDIRIKRCLTTSLEDAVRSMAWRQLEMIVFKIEFLKKLIQPEMVSIAQGTRGIGDLSSD